MLSPLAKKLRIKEDLKCLFINIPDNFNDEFKAELEPYQNKNIKTGTADYVHLFVANKNELNKHLQNALKKLKYDGVFWISYPKQSSSMDSDLNRDILWELMKDVKMRAVSAVSVNKIWSALRFRPAEVVKTKK